MNILFTTMKVEKKILYLQQLTDFQIKSYLIWIH